MRELHIGHAIVSRAVFVGMREAVREMKAPDGARRRGDLRRRHRRGRDRAHRRARSSATASASRAASCARRSCARFQRHRLPANYLAKRFAAKEAFTKALGTGIQAPANWHGVWVSNLPSGKPVLEFSEAAEAAPCRSAAFQARTSRSTDERGVAMATVILECAK